MRLWMQSWGYFLLLILFVVLSVTGVLDKWFGV